MCVVLCIGHLTIGDDVSAGIFFLANILSITTVCQLESFFSADILSITTVCQLRSFFPDDILSITTVCQLVCIFFHVADIEFITSVCQLESFFQLTYYLLQQCVNFALY